MNENARRRLLIAGMLGHVGFAAAAMQVLTEDGHEVAMMGPDLSQHRPHGAPPAVHYSAGRRARLRGPSPADRLLERQRQRRLRERA